ncbi:hypothetical protein [uncultured Shewanella sp.]|uniref:hypothetical protein n=1 Tax=uncultured Shewanella sp. TaxID=173975 RepID=UPI00261897B6|nr:hypothetical protein [uncultured Shewanella sp.]
MILLSSISLAKSSAASGASDLLPALILRGFGVGLLNHGVLEATPLRPGPDLHYR